MNVFSHVKRFFKIKVKRLVSPIRRLVATTKHASGTHFCPICGGEVSFLPFGKPPRANARCPMCSSLERHRLDWMFFTKQTDLFDGSNKKFLHLAPEECISARLRSIDNLDYLSADLIASRAMVQMDITDINYPDNYFSAIYCSHVLEHIPDDRKALAELYRVLCQGGWAVLQVPITAERTYENPAIIEPEEREKHFDQWDHVRLCGPDYVERMRDAGFVAQVLRSTDVVTEADCARMGFKPTLLIFFCRKPSSSESLHGTR